MINPDISRLALDFNSATLGADDSVPGRHVYSLLFIIHRSFGGFLVAIQRFESRMALAALLSLTIATAAIGQAAANPSQSSSEAAASAPQTPACVALADASIPVNSTVEAKVMGIDSAHLKPGKEIWFKVARGIVYPGCTLEADSVVYARVMSATGSKDAGSSELSLSFERADCSGHDKQPFKLRVIAVVGPADPAHHKHEDMPAEVAGGGRQMEQVVAGTNALDAELNPGGPPHTVRPGVVVGVPKLKLEPTAGPECSDKMTSTNSKIQLSSGSELILAVTQTR